MHFSRHVVKVASLLLLTVTVVVIAGQRGAHKKHVRFLKQFSCSEPQPRVFSLEQVMNKTILQDLTDRGLRDSIKPSMTVLHRCRSTGCCENYLEKCSPAIRPEKITLTFAIFDTKVHFFDVTVKNHTRCACGGRKYQSIK